MPEQKSNPLQNEVLAKVFHDFNNVVSVLLLNMELLEEHSSKDEKMKDRLAKIRATVGRLRFVAQHLKIPAGHPENGPYDLLVVLKDLETEFKKVFPHLEVLKMPSVQPARLTSDPWFLKNIFVFIAREISEHFQPHGSVGLKIDQEPEKAILTFEANESAKAQTGLSAGGAWIKTLANALQIELKIQYAPKLEIELKIPLLPAQ